MGPEGSIYEGKTLEQAIGKGLEALGLSRAEVMIQVLEEGSGGFLGLGARPYRVRIKPRPGGAPHEPDDRGRRDGRGRRDRHERGRGRREERVGPSREGERRGGRDRDGRRRDRVEARGSEGRRDEPRRDEPRRDEPRRDEPRRDEPRRDEPRRSEERRDYGRRDEPRRDDSRRDDSRRDEGRRPERRDRGESDREPMPAMAGESRPRGEDGEEGDHRRRRRGRRGGRRRREERELSAGAPGESREPREMRESPESREVHESREPREMREPGEPREMRESPESREVHESREPREAREPREESRPAETVAPAYAHLEEPEDSQAVTMGVHRPAATAFREREPSVSTAEMLSPEDLAALGRRATEDLLKAMGFEARVEATAEADQVNVTAEVQEQEDLLTGPKGEVRQALQHLLNLTINRGHGARYHLQLEINDFWRQREEELRDLAHKLAEEALTNQSEAVTEYLNAQERRIVHMTLKEDSRVKTYALGSGLIKRVAVAPADFPEAPRQED